MLALKERRAPFVARKEPFAFQDENSWEYRGVEGGLPAGSLVEISGTEAHKAAARFLAEHPLLPVAWIEADLKPFPEAVARTRLNYDKVLFIDGGKDSSWAASSILTSRCFSILVYHAPYAGERELRRFRKQAKASGTTMILLREMPSFSASISLQLRANASKVEIVRRRNV